MTTVELLNLASKIVEFRRLAMLLLAECPQNGEYAARPGAYLGFRGVHLYGQ